MPRDLFGAPEIATQPPDAAPTGEYRDRGAYFTPDALALRCCRALAEAGIHPKSILEPGCGGGAFLRASAVLWPHAELLGIDLVPCCEGPGTVRRQDFFAPALAGPFELIIGNPPFDVAEDFILRSLALVPEGGYVAFLLRLALTAGVRDRLYPAHPLFRLHPIGPRPSFTGGGSDKAQEYGLLVWKRGWRGDFTGSRLVWR